MKSVDRTGCPPPPEGRGGHPHSLLNSGDDFCRFLEQSFRKCLSILQTLIWRLKIFSEVRKYKIRYEIKVHKLARYK